MGIARKLADLLDNDGDVKLDKQRAAYVKPASENINYISGLQTALDGKVDDSQVLTDVPSGALFTDTTYSVGDAGLTEKNFTTTDNIKLDGIADSANNYIHPSNHSISEVTGLQTALDSKTNEAYVDTQVAAIVDAAPGTLDSLNELAAALGDDPNFATTMSTSLGNRYTKAETDAKIVALSPPATKSHVDSLGINASTVNNKTVGINVPSNALFTDTTYSVGDGGLTEKNFTTADNIKLDGIAAGANNYSLPSSVVHSSEAQALNADALRISGHIISLYKGDGTYESVTVPDNNTTYSVGDGGLTQKNFTTTLKNKLDGIASSANNYSHPTSAGNKHIPTGGATDQYLKYSASGTAVWSTISTVFPFFKSDGTSDTITITNGTFPFYKADGSADNIGVS